MTVAETPLETRVAKLETHIETERPHLATNADLERQTRIILMWLCGAVVALFGLMLHLHNQQIALIQSQLGGMKRNQCGLLRLCNSFENCTMVMSSRDLAGRDSVSLAL